MASVFDVADYFLVQSDDEAGDAITNLKLQKLVYYAQGIYLALKGEQLFPESIQAWTHGPVVPDLYHKYKDYGGSALPKPSEINEAALTGEQRELLDEVYSVYGQFSAWKLRNMTHDEGPWEPAYRTGVNTEITPAALREYFVSKVN